jgi:hypothetical protein
MKRCMPKIKVLLMVFIIVCSVGGCVGKDEDEANAGNPNSPYLSNILISQGSLNPRFSSLQLTYSVSESDFNSWEEITVTAVPEGENATVTIMKVTIDEKLMETSYSPYLTYLRAGEKITIAVTSEDGKNSVSYSLICLPGDFPSITVMVSEAPSPGYFFISNFNIYSEGTISNENIGKYLMILDNSGVPIWYKKMDVVGADFKVQPTGDLSYVNFESEEKDIFGTSHPVIAMNSNFEETGSFRCMTANTGEEITTDSHDSIMLDNGNVILIGWIGRNADLSQYGGPPDVIKIDNIIQEIDPDGNVVFEWEVRDHVSLETLPPVFFAPMVTGFTTLI